MPLPLRKAGLALHVAASVGWIGAVTASLVIGIAATVTSDQSVIRGAYLSMQIIGWYALVPFSLASLLTGLIQAFGTTWGLLRHYWVVIKLTMNLFAAAVLLLYMQTVDYLANSARSAAATGNDMAGNPSPILHAAGALILLGVALTLSIYKPRGLTRRGRRTGFTLGRAPAH